MWKYIAIPLVLLSTVSFAQDNVGDGSTNGDLNTNMGNSNTVDSNNASNTSTTNYNGAGSSPGSQPVPSAISPTMMGGGGNDSCLIPKSQGIQISIIGISQGEMEQDPECNRRKDARLIGAPQQVGGLGLQVSGISVMCANPQVFKAMALANTPCPIVDVVTGKLLIGKQAYMKMRSKPEVYIVGYNQAKMFWKNLLYIGRNLPDAPEQVTVTRSLSDKFRSTSGANNGGTPSSRRSNRSKTGTGK
jgi:hypothetical protein